MPRLIAVISTLVLLAALPLFADYAVEGRGSWPQEWPKELEPLRGQSQTFEGPKQLLRHYAIPFTKREAFESAWPHILKTKGKGAPIVLRRGPSFWLGGKSAAGVCIHTPPMGEAALTGDRIKGGAWEETIYIELIVDGQIVDLNRIPLPADTPILDERFKDDAAK